MFGPYLELFRVTDLVQGMTNNALTFQGLLARPGCRSDPINCLRTDCEHHAFHRSLDTSWIIFVHSGISAYLYLYIYLSKIQDERALSTQIPYQRSQTHQKTL